MDYKKFVSSGLVISTCMFSAVAMAELPACRYFERGVLFQARAKVTEAIENYSKAIELDASYAPSYYNRGVCLTTFGESEKALADFNKAIELNDKYVSAYTRRGEYYLAKGDKEKAIADCNKALSYAPTNKAALALKAKCEK
ncbi:MAG: tetratricopeptide repeat protein [Phascolarctobacterium sp.]|nr:tetratricopeptide repeat protein [Phascolarctobacterium sp.]